MKNDKSQHILNTSSNLLGFCLIVLTSLKISKVSAVSMIDEFTGVACILLVTCSMFSFLSMRTKDVKATTTYEKIADTIFILSLIFIFAITFMVAFSFIF